MSENNALCVLTKRVKKYFSKKDALVLVLAFAAALLVHFFGFADKYINYDDVDGLYSNCDFALASGRWFLQAVHALTGNISSSWLNGLLGSFSLALSSMLVVKLFRITRLLPAFLLSLCMIAFPTVASTYAYMFSSGAYLFAMLLAVAGVYFVRTEKPLGLAAGVVLLALSMGCYQAYFCLAALLLVGLLIYDLCTNRWEGKFKPFLAAALKYLGALALGLAVYYVVLQVLLKITGTVLTEYQGISGMGQITLPILLRRIQTAYQSYGDFLGNKLFNIFGRTFPILAGLSLLVGLITAAVCVIKNKVYRQWVSMVFLVLLLAIYPLASGLIYVMTDVNIHLLMIYPMVGTLILPCFAIQHLHWPCGLWLRRGAALLMAALILLQGMIAHEFVYVTNRAYFAMDLTYENVYAYYLKLAAKIELTEGYQKDTPVVIIGTMTMDNFVPEPNMTGVLVGDAALNIYSYDRIFAYYMGTSYVFASEEAKAAIMQTEAYQAMPCYPAAGSIRVIGDTITVKMSE